MTVIEKIKKAREQLKTIEGYLDSASEEFKKEIDETGIMIRTVKDLKEFLSQFPDETPILFYKEFGSQCYLDNLTVLGAASCHKKEDVVIIDTGIDPLDMEKGV